MIYNYLCIHDKIIEERERKSVKGKKNCFTLEQKYNIIHQTDNLNFSFVDFSLDINHDTILLENWIMRKCVG